MSPQSRTATVPAQSTGPNTGGQIAAAVLKYLTERPGQPVFRAEIADALGLTPTQVRVAVTNLRAKDVFGAHEAIETQVSGQVWVWHPNKAKLEPVEVTPAKVKRVFGEIGTTREGDLILQADDNTLWRATEL